MFLNSKRRSLFFGSNSERSSNSPPAPSTTSTPKSTFKTFSVIHVNNPDEYKSQDPNLKHDDPVAAETITPSQEPRSSKLVRKSSSFYRTEETTLKPSLSVMSRRRPPPTVDINSVYESINRNVKALELENLDEDSSSSVYVSTPVDKMTNYKLFSQNTAVESSIDEHVLDDIADSHDELCNDSFTASIDYVQAKSNEKENESESEASSESTSGLELSSKEAAKLGDNDFTISSNYNINHNGNQFSPLNEFTKRHNRERSQVEEYLEELEEFELSDNGDLEQGDSVLSKPSLHDTTFEYAADTLSYLQNEELESVSESNFFGNAPSGLKVVNAASETQGSSITTDTELSEESADEPHSLSSYTSFDGAHSQLSAVKSLYHREEDGLQLDHLSLPSLPYTIDNHSNHITPNTTASNHLDGDYYSNDLISPSLSPNKLDIVSESLSTGGINTQCSPRSTYVTNLLHKNPTTNRSKFNFQLPLNLQSNPVEDINAKTAIFRQQRKSKNIKHKTEKKKLLSNEEPSPIEMMKSKANGLNSHMLSDSLHGHFSAGIDDEERFVLENLPGAEGYEENSLAKDTSDYSSKRSRANRNRADTAKSYYTRNVNRFRAETLSTITASSGIDHDALQIINPDAK